VGYDLEGPQTVEVKTGETTTLDLKLIHARDLASQLSNSEWLTSFPGTEQEKSSIRACAHCHTLERIARSRYDVDRLTTVIERMATYPQLSFPMKIQKLVAARIGGGEDPLEQRQAGWRRQAQYLSTVNLSKGDHWSYALKTHPRPKGRATRVIYTEYDLPQRTRQPHDVIVDSRGFAWYASFGEQILGKVDVKTGAVTEYDVPLLKPKMPTGILAARFDEDQGGQARRNGALPPGQLPLQQHPHPPEGHQAGHADVEEELILRRRPPERPGCEAHQGEGTGLDRPAHEPHRPPTHSRLHRATISNDGSAGAGHGSTHQDS
jgi:hypothetical protein